MFLRVSLCLKNFITNFTICCNHITSFLVNMSIAHNDLFVKEN